MSTKENPETIIKNFLRYIGENPEREGLLETPKRVVKSWETIFGGYKIDPKEILNTQFSNEFSNEIIICKNIEFYSTCEHHLLPIIGKAHVAYKANGHVFGLSKLARLVDCFARRLQIQERLTNQIANTLIENGAVASGVIIDAKHMCMCARGVAKQGSSMVTSSYLGDYKILNNIKTELYQQINLAP